MYPGLQLTAALSATLAAVAIAGCGSSGSSSGESQPTTATPASSNASSSATPQKAPKADIQMRSVSQLEPIPARYSCDGANVPLPLSWSKVPPDTAEIDLFIFNSLPVNGKLVSEWGVAGLPPTLRKLSGGRLPRGAVLARNSFGGTDYSLCPPKGSTIGYAVLLYASPHRTHAKPGFDPEALVEKHLQHTAESEGRIYFSYKRG